MKSKVKHGTKLVAQQRDKRLVVCSINQTVREDPENNLKQLKPVLNETGSPGTSCIKLNGGCKCYRQTLKY